MARYLVSRNRLLTPIAPCTAYPQAAGTPFTVTLTSSAAPVTVTDGTKTYTAEYSAVPLQMMPEWFAVDG